MLLWLGSGLLLAAALAGMLAAFGAMMELGTIWGRGGLWANARQVALLGVLFFPLFCLLCVAAAWGARAGAAWFLGAPFIYAGLVVGLYLLAQAQQSQPISRAPPDPVQLSEWLAARPGVVEVDVSGSGLTEVPVQLRVDSLEVINLARNPIGALPEWLGQLPRLRLLYLGETGISEAEVRRWQATLARPVAVMQ